MDLKLRLSSMNSFSKLKEVVRAGAPFGALLGSESAPSVPVPLIDCLMITFDNVRVISGSVSLDNVNLD